MSEESATSNADTEPAPAVIDHAASTTDPKAPAEPQIEAASMPDAAPDSDSVKDTESAAPEAAPAQDGDADQAVAAPQPIKAGGEREPTVRERAIAILFENFQNKTPVNGKVIGWNRGGFHVSLAGVGAFCPRSQIELSSPRSPTAYMDRDFAFEILEMDQPGKRIVLSRKEPLAEERKIERQELSKKLEPGAVLEGRIDSLSDFGAFVDLGGGIRGLVHVSELSWQRVERPEEVVRVGEQVEVKVLKIEQKGKRISLSRREMLPDPWEGLEDKFARGSEFKGKIARETDFGLFVEVGDGVEGLLHSSQLPIGASIDDAKFAAGEEIEGWVREVDRGRNRLSLTLREVPEGDPWNGVAARLEEGSVVEGLVEQSSRFGFFVTLEPGLTGLLPFSAVSAPNGRRREDTYRAGQQINVTIMDLDPRRKRISLGLEGAKAEGSKADLHAYKKRQDQDSGSLNAIAAAFEKLNLGG